MASGKSTVAELLSERFVKSVHLRGDIFRRMIVNNRREVHPDAGSDELNQLRLRYRLAAQSADAYFQAGFTVIVQDVVVGPMLDDFISYIQSRPFNVVVLCPNPLVVTLRESARLKKGYGIWTVGGLDSLLRDDDFIELSENKSEHLNAPAALLTPPAASPPVPWISCTPKRAARL
ncbi:phosphotransferase [Paenibacillus sp. WST5]|uniref:Phosphotransferase n=2 Tax=Paenibacillus sedimenti TaxID=2770274 RepID=A0A926QHJ4_9BACL|nr:phosphotransferase [Paenibacillus sedimenti]